MKEGYISVYRASDETIANIVKIALEDAGIHAVVDPVNASFAYDGIFARAEGFWGDVLVERENAEKALEILKEYDSGKYMSESEEE